MSYNKFYLFMNNLFKNKFEGGFKSKNTNKGFLVKVLKYVHIARRSRYNFYKWDKS